MPVRRPTAPSPKPAVASRATPAAPQATLALLPTRQLELPTRQRPAESAQHGAIAPRLLGFVQRLVGVVDQSFHVRVMCRQHGSAHTDRDLQVLFAGQALDACAQALGERSYAHALDSAHCEREFVAAVA